MSPHQESLQKLRIEYTENFPPNFELPLHFQIILRMLFDNHHTIIVVSKFGSGFTDGLVLRIQPIGEQGKKLLSVVKLGLATLTEPEFKAYDTYISGTLPRAIGITKHITFNDGYREWGGLLYTSLAGEEISEFEELDTYFQSHQIDDISITFKDLFKALSKLHRDPKEKQASYDRVLPVNLEIKSAATVNGEVPKSGGSYELTPEKVDLELHHEMAIYVSGFKVTEIDEKEQTVTLDRPSTEASPETSFRIRIKLESASDLPAFQIGLPMPLVEGVLEKTRMDHLNEDARNALKDTKLQLLRKAIRFNNGRELPNPLLSITHILKRILEKSVWVGSIHGDLNFRNVLVDLQRKMVNFIDFACSRQDHLLHDFLRLEVEIVVKQLSTIISLDEKLSFELIEPFYVNLTNICARNMTPHKSAWLIPELEKPFKILIEIRKAAQACFYRSKDEKAVEEDKGFFLTPSDWAEYNEYLVIYLLSILKFANLNQESKKIALLGAATLIGQSDALDKTQINGNAKVMPLDKALKWLDLPQILYIRPGEEKRIQVNTHLANISVSESGMLTIRSWIREPEDKDKGEHGYRYELKIQSSYVLNGWPYAPHKCKFERLIGVKQTVAYNDDLAILLERDKLSHSITDVWWIRHQRDRNSDTRILIFVENTQI